MTHVVIVKAYERFWLMLNRPKATAATIKTFRTEQEAVDFFSLAYKRAHDRGYESSMSAAVHWLTFQLCVISFDSEEELLKWVGCDMTVCTIGNIGTIYVADIDQEKAADQVEGGRMIRPFG